MTTHRILRHHAVSYPESNFAAFRMDASATFPQRPVFNRLTGSSWGGILLISTLLLFSASEAGAHEPIPSDELSRQVHFATDVVPILTKLGCNGGGCHGKATGQNGFKLSLFGFEPELDHQAIARDARGRRLFPGAPNRSLLLLKATSETPHGGGRRLDRSSEDYEILLNWIAQGAPAPKSDDPQLIRIEVSPAGKVLRQESATPLNVTAFFSDGSFRDVTRQAVYESNHPNVAGVDADGVVTTTSQSGLVSVMVRLGEQITTFDAAVPFARDEPTATAVQAQLDDLEGQIGDSLVNRLLLRQWRRMGILPSAPADDATMIRRATIDICGTLPTNDEVRAYLADKSENKLPRLIDQLLERPEYASYFALKWADILQNRGAGYSTSRQREGTTLFSSWIRDSIADNKPYDQFVSEIMTAGGSQKLNPPTIWYRSVRESPEYVESVAQAFLGVRIQCAQCHHHPTEHWTQSDYYGLAAVFSRVGRKGGFADAEVPTDEVIFVKSRGNVTHPLTGEALAPKPLGDPAFDLNIHADPRRELARWMTDGENPFFARTMVNRTWAHFLGRGIIHPIDDARSTNPPTNPELLNALSNEFIMGGFDMKQLIRTIVGSYVYRLESAPHDGNAGDVQTFARFYPRRLSAEVLLDGLSQVLDVPTEFPGMPAGTRAIDLPDENVAAHFLDVFGRPARMSACECERVDAPSLAQTLELVNSEEIQRKLSAESGYVNRLATGQLTTKELANQFFLTVLARQPLPAELEAATEFLDSQDNRVIASRDLMWSLLATNEFLFNH